MDVKWIKITTDIFDDDKILLIESLPDADALIVIWFKLLCLAGKQNNGGVFLMNDRIAYTDKMLATIFRRNEATVSLALQTFEKFGMIEVVDGVITIPKWEAHQNVDGLERLREQRRLASARFREKQKLLASANAENNITSNITSDITVIQRNKTDKNKNKEKDKDKEIREDTHSDGNFEYLWAKYPKKHGKQSALKAYRNAVKEGVSYDDVFTGIERYVAYLKFNKTPLKYIKDGSSFFNQRAWENEWLIDTRGRTTKDLAEAMDFSDMEV